MDLFKAKRPAKVGNLDTVDESGAAMTFYPSFYIRSGGLPTLYINTDRHCTIQVPDKNWKPAYPPQQQRYLDIFLEALDDELTVPFTGDLNTHRSGPRYDLALGMQVVRTNDFTVGGQDVLKNGDYLIYNNKLFSLEKV